MKNAFEVVSLRGLSSPAIYVAGVKLIRATQGMRSVSDSHVEDYANGAESEAFGVFEGGRLVGVATARIDTANESPIVRRLHSIVPASLPDKTIGHLRSLSVAPEFQRQGLGSALTLARLNWFKDQGCAGAYAISWASGLPNNSGAVLRSLQFQMVERIERFYRDALINENASCLVCGARCDCAAELYYKRF